MIEELTKYLINKDKPNGGENEDNSNRWGAGSQLEALRFYFDKKVKILAEFIEDDYSGECGAILQVDGKCFIWRDCFGSCSGCDALEDKNGYEYIKATMTSVKEFETVGEVKAFLIKKAMVSYFQGEGADELLNKLIKGFKKDGKDTKDTSS